MHETRYSLKRADGNIQRKIRQYAKMAPIYLVRRVT